MDLDQAYALVSAMASPSHDEGLQKQRAVLLLWFLRNVVGIDDLDAYEFICDGDSDQGIDGAYIEERGVDDEKDTLVLLQSKYPERPSKVGKNEIAEFQGKALPFESLEGFKDLMAGNVQPELRALLTRLEVETKLAAGELEVRLVFVTAGKLNSEAKKQIEAANLVHKRRYIEHFDLPKLGPIIQAVTEPKTVEAVVEVACPSAERFVTNAGTGRIAVCAVKATDIVKWPGIEDRTLFDLNVRHELRPNRVRRELDSAIRKSADHPNFLAFHNGITVVCEELDDQGPDKLIITNMSVVNGTQSAVALKTNEDHVTDDLRLVVKFVELGPEHPVAREVARRSNTQNPVNPRNLRALDGRQLILKQEFSERFPNITYETRPDYSNPATGHVIHNDHAAQLLAAVYNERPWVAVKRLSLFEGAQYTEIFSQGISAEHVVLVDRIRQRVQESKDRFPDEYQRSWQLTALVAVYLVGQLMRADQEMSAYLATPKQGLEDADLDKKFDDLVKHAAGSMQVRADTYKREEKLDDFKVDFKREDALRTLAKQARERYVYSKTIAT